MKQLGTIGKTTSAEWQGLDEATKALKLWRLQTQTRRAEDHAIHAAQRGRRISGATECTAAVGSSLERCK